MEEATFKKDTTPYLIFECSRCRQFMYVKTTQKEKKCLRCGRTHVVSKLVVEGEIVYGMTAAVEEVKKKQNEFAVSELGHSPELRAFEDFKVAGFTPQDQGFVPANLEVPKEEEDYSDRFLQMLKEIAKNYRKFPGYVIEVMADNFLIPHLHLKFLIKLFLKKGILKKLEANSYSIVLG